MTPERYAWMRRVQDVCLTDQEFDTIIATTERRWDQLKMRFPRWLVERVEWGPFHDASLKSIVHDGKRFEMEVKSLWPERKEKEVLLWYESATVQSIVFHLDTAEQIIGPDVKTLLPADWFWDEFDASTKGGAPYLHSIFLQKGGRGAVVDIEFESCGITPLTFWEE